MYIYIIYNIIYIYYLYIYICYIVLQYICSWMDLQDLYTNFGTSFDSLELNSNFSSTKLQHGGKRKRSQLHPSVPDGETVAFYCKRVHWFHTWMFSLAIGTWLIRWPFPTWGGCTSTNKWRGYRTIVRGVVSWCILTCDSENPKDCQILFFPYASLAGALVSNPIALNIRIINPIAVHNYPIIIP